MTKRTSEFTIVLTKLISEIKKSYGSEDFNILSYFETSFGKDFAKSYDDLCSFIISATILPSFLKSQQNFLDFIFSGQLTEYLQTKISSTDDINKEDIQKIDNIVQAINSLNLDEPKKVQEKDELTEFIEEILVKLPDKYIIAASGVTGYKDPDRIKTKKIGKLLLCQDTQALSTDEDMLYAPRVSLIANWEANLAIELILSEKNEHNS